MIKSLTFKPRIFTPYWVINPEFLIGVFGDIIPIRPVVIITETKNEYAFIIARGRKSIFNEWMAQYEVLIEKAKNGQLFRVDSLVDISKIYFVKKRDFIKSTKQEKEPNKICINHQYNILKTISNAILKDPPNITFMQLICLGFNKNNSYYERQIIYTTEKLLTQKEWRQKQNNPNRKISKEELLKRKWDIINNLDHLCTKNIKKVKQFRKIIKPHLAKLKSLEKNKVT